MIGGFLGGLANLGAVNRGMNLGIDEGSQAMLSLLALQQAQQQYQQQQQLLPMLYGGLQQLAQQPQQPLTPQAPAVDPSALTGGFPQAPPPSAQPGLSYSPGPSAGAYPVVPVSRYPLLDPEEGAGGPGFGGRPADPANFAPEWLQNTMLRTEGGRPGAVSSKGALGPAQVMPGTARQMGYTPAQASASAAPGRAYLNQLYAKSGGDPAAALVGYNMGPGGMAKFQASGDKLSSVPGLEPAYKRVVASVQNGAADLQRMGVHPKITEASSDLANGAVQNIDPSAWGRSSIKMVVDAIEKSSPGAPTELKALAAMQLLKIMQPEDQMAMRMIMAQNRNDLAYALQNLRGDQAYQRLLTREHAIDVRQAASFAEREKLQNQRIAAAGAGKIPPASAAKLKQLKQQQISMNAEAARYGGWAGAPPELVQARDAVDEQIDEILGAATEAAGGEPAPSLSGTQKKLPKPEAPKEGPT